MHLLLHPVERFEPGVERQLLQIVEAQVPLLGAPALWAGKCYLMTKDGLHCFGDKDG